MICTDWGLLTDSEIAGLKMPARAWGVEHLSRPERAQKAIEAGVDQFGGEACPEIIVELVGAGHISEIRINDSVRRILRDKFRLGLFDDPYVDLDAAGQIVGKKEFRDAAVLDVIFGRFVPSGRLPFELPSSMAAVRGQRSDIPYDTLDRLFPMGHGLNYRVTCAMDGAGLVLYPGRYY